MLFTPTLGAETQRVTVMDVKNTASNTLWSHFLTVRLDIVPGENLSNTGFKKFKLCYI